MLTVYDEIAEERAYQEGLWGNEADDVLNTPWMWASFIGFYATKWMNGFHPFSRDKTDEFRKCMVKVAAIAVAAVQSIDRQRAENGRTFYEENE